MQVSNLLCCLLFTTLLIVSVCGQSSALTSDQKLYSALSLALDSVRTSGKLEKILTKYGSDLDGQTCSASSLYSWPTVSNLGSALDNIISTKTLKLCRSLTLSPYFNYTTGLEVEVANEVVGVLSTKYSTNIQVQWVRLATNTGFFTSLMDGLNKNLCDAALSVIAVNPERAAIGNFTCSYANGHKGFLQGPRNITTLLSEDTNTLNQTGLIITAVPGTINYDLARLMTKATILDVAETSIGIQYVVDGVASVFIGDTLFFSPLPCSQCKKFVYGAPSPFAILLRQTPIISHATSSTQLLSYVVLVAISAILSLVL